jgi:DNA adenine methylase
MYQKPFLKWVGGKTQLINTLIDSMPTEIVNYHELFLGGGSVMLAVLSAKKIGKLHISGNVYCYDINKSLINLYKDVQSNLVNLENYLSKLVDNYNSRSSTLQENYYYTIRNEYNNCKESVEKSAMFLFLNRSCFRGLYREGPNGFNVPSGHYKKIAIPSLKKINKLIKNVIFECVGFEDSIKLPSEGDFVYLDPPYVPESTKSFVKYNNNGFDMDKHCLLFRELLKLEEYNNVLFMMSNSKTQLILDYFGDYPIKEIVAKRAINSKNPSATTVEVLITNYCKQCSI